MAELKPTGNGEPRKNVDEKPRRVADKRPEAGCEAATVGERPQREKTASNGSGRDSGTRRVSNGRAEVPAFSFKVNFYLNADDCSYGAYEGSVARCRLC